MVSFLKRFRIKTLNLFGIVTIEIDPVIPTEPGTATNKRGRRTRVSVAREEFPPAGTGRYILLLEAPYVEGQPSPRYVHFSWKRNPDGIAFCVRDFLANGEWRQGESSYSAVDYWGVAIKRIKCSSEEGLFKSAEEFPEFWREELERRTQADASSSP
jgi:hypothetical protein